jgi:RNA polymerase sigma-70 factor (ECF subfamily)
MPPFGIDDSVVERLYRLAKAEGWRLRRDVFAEALHASARRAFRDTAPQPVEVVRYLETLHLEDLALACACAEGDDAAWEHFVKEHRPVLYRAAAAIDPGGGARDLADSLYADLYGLATSADTRKSLFRYFHGRSTLATWLRAVLSQRHIDRVRAERRTQPLPDDELAPAAVIEPSLPEPGRSRWLSLLGDALRLAVSRLDARDRLRLGCYYAQGMTLAEVGRLLREHEATVSRRLAHARRALRRDVESQLRENAGLSDTEIEECFESVASDPGPIDLGDIFVTRRERKKST